MSPLNFKPLNRADVLEPGKMYESSIPGTYHGIYAFSNDGSIPASVLMNLREVERGIAFHLGSGAMFSLIDKHDLTPLLIDRDKKTVIMQKVIEQAILACATVKDTTDAIIVTGKKLLGLDADSLRTALLNETKEHQVGRLHWTNRFNNVKEAIMERPPIYVRCDIRDQEFIPSLVLTAEKYGPLQFLNLTNIHNHLAHQSMDFIETLPISPDATILFSDWSEVQYSTSGLQQALRREYSDITTYLSYTRYAMLDN